MSAILRFFLKRKKKSVQSLIYTVSRNDEKRKQKKEKYAEIPFPGFKPE